MEYQHHEGTHGKTSGFLRLTLGMTVAANKNPTVVLGKHFGTSSFRTNPNKINQSIRFLPVDAAGDAGRR